MFSKEEAANLKKEFCFMKFLVLVFVFCNTVLFYSQNKFKEISRNRIKISKFVFGEILDNNTFNSSLVTSLIFKNKYL